MSARCLLVVGMHRSGTSALARILANAGYVLGHEVISDGPDNPAGFWENSAVVALHEELLSGLGSAWDDPRPMPENWLETKVARQALSRLQGLLVAEFGNAERFVVKDPRLCRLLPLWKIALANLGIDSGVVLVVRNPVEVASSLARRNRIGSASGQWLWASCMANAWLDSSAWPRAILEYGRLLEDPDAVLTDVADALGLQGFASDTYSTLDRRLRNHRSDAAPFEPAGELYRALLAFSPNAGEVNGLAQSIMEQPVPAGQVRQWIVRLIESLQYSRRDAARNAGDAAALQAAMGQVNAWAAERDEALATQLSQVAVLEGELAQATRFGAERDEALTANLLKIVALEGELAQATRFGAERDEALTVNLLRIAALEGELAQATRFGAERDEALTVNLLKIVALEGELAQATRWGTERDEALALQKARASSLEADLTQAVADRQNADLKIRNLQVEQSRMEHRIDELLARTEEMVEASRVNEQRNREIHDGLQNQINLLKTWQVERERRQYFTQAARFGLQRMRQGAHQGTRHLKSMIKSGLKGICLAWPGSSNAKEARLEYLRTLNLARNGVNHRAILKDVYQLANNRWPAQPAYVVRGRPVPQAWPEIDVSVVLYNSGRWIAGFMDSILASSYPLEKLCLHFREHGHDDGSRLAIDSWMEAHPDVCFGALGYSKGANVGFGAGHNHNFRLGQADWFIVANVDGRFAEDAIQKVVLAGLNSEPEVAAFELRQVPYEHPKYYDPVTMQVSWFSGACVMFKRKSYGRVKGFDDSIFMYGEDVELSYRMRSLGMSLAYVPTAVFQHDTYEEANAFKPLQFHGSTLANLLLRMRYGTLRDFIGMPAMLKELASSAKAQSEFPGFRRNMIKLLTRAPGYMISRLWTRRIPLPFNRWDYGLRRDGAFERVQPVRSGPLVSIVVRTYRGRTTLLEQALCSIANQTYSNVEVVVVEDKGDSQREVVEACAARWGLRIRYEAIEHAGSNRCVTGNRGLQVAQGKYANFLDDDDLLFADHVEYLVSSFLKEPASYVAHYALSWQVSGTWNEHGRYVERTHEAPPGFRREFDRDVLAAFNYMPIQAVMFERSLYDRYGGFDSRLENLEDWELWRRYSRAGNFKLAPKTTSLFHVPACAETRAQRQAKLDEYYPIADAIAESHQEIKDGGAA